MPSAKSECGADSVEINVCTPSPVGSTSGDDVTELDVVAMLGGQPTKLAAVAGTRANTSDLQVLDNVGGDLTKRAALAAEDAQTESGTDISTTFALEAAAKGLGLDLTSLQETLDMLTDCLAGTVAHPRMLALTKKCRDPGFLVLSEKEIAASLQLTALLDAAAENAVTAHSAEPSGVALSTPPRGATKYFQLIHLHVGRAGPVIE